MENYLQLKFEEVPGLLSDLLARPDVNLASFKYYNSDLLKDANVGEALKQKIKALKGKK